ncbi:MAG TPA: MFS transporter [Symbiobacteriaceae bacterium]
MQRKFPLYALITANIISNIGNQLTLLAVPWFVLETTGSASKAGITGFFSMLPAILATFFSGPIIDRVGYKRVSILSDIMSGITVALIPLLHHTVGLSFWQLQVLVFMSALLDAPGSTARFSIVPELSQAAEIPLERTNAVRQLANQLAILASPLLGGVLVTRIGASNVLWVDAFTFLVSAVTIAIGIPARLVPAPIKTEERNSLTAYVRDLKAGFRFVRTDRLLASMFIVQVLLNFLVSPLEGVLLPAYCKQVLNSPTALGAILSGIGAGSIVGTALYATVAPRFSRRVIYLSAWVLMALLQLGMSFLPPLPYMITLAVLLGVAYGPINPIIQTLQQERVPTNMRARVFGMLAALTDMAMPLGPVVAGFAIETIGIERTYLVMAIIYLIVVLTQFFNRRLREMDRSPGTIALQEFRS